MKAASSRSAHEMLDAVQSLVRLEEFAIDDYAAQLASELAALAVDDAGLAARDEALAAALGTLDGFAARAMRIRLDHALADDTALPAALRATLAATVVSYADDPERLRHRVATSVARIAPARAAVVANQVVDASDAVLDQRAALAEAILALARSLAAAALPLARGAAGDRTLDDSARARWSSIRQELEAVVAAPHRLVSGPWAKRVAAHAPVDELPAVDEPSFGELIELD